MTQAVCILCGVKKTVTPNAVDDLSRYRCGNCTKRFHSHVRPDWSLQRKLRMLDIKINLKEVK